MQLGAQLVWVHYATASSFAGIPVSVVAAGRYTVDPLGPDGWLRDDEARDRIDPRGEPGE